MKRSLASTAIVVALCASACETQQGFQKAMDGDVGTSEAGLVGSMGPPQNIYVAPDGSRILTYSRSETKPMGGTMTYRPVTSTSNSSVGVASYKPTTTTSLHPVQEPTYSVTLSCTIVLHIVNDRVQRYCLK